ncbi:DUF1858 domain-containing protein [Candidatus Margulisiibacteriota bacterium]
MIKKEMNIAEVLGKFPETMAVLQEHGIGCIGCMMAHSESLEQGLSAHGLNADEIIKEMNTLVKTK